MHSPNFTHEKVAEFFKEVAYELDEQVFLEKVEQAVMSGLDLKAASPHANRTRNNDLSVIQALINVANEKPRRTLIRKYDNAMEGLHAQMRKGSTLAHAYLQVAVEDGLVGPGEEGVFEHVLQGPMSEIVPGLLYSAQLGGADTTPPADTNWFQVLAQNPRAFPDEEKHQVANQRWFFGWSVVGALLDLGFDPCSPPHTANQTMQTFNELLEKCADQAPTEIHRRLRSSFEAFELETSYTQIAPARARARF